MYERTQGVLDLAVKLYQYTQRRAIDSGIEEIDTGLIHAVANEEFTRVAPMVEALASGDIAKIAKFGDLAMPEFESEVVSDETTTIHGMNLQKLLAAMKVHSQTHGAR
jgi:hypothetical protein